MKTLNVKIFDDIRVSTKTFTANTNIIIDIHKLFDIIEVTPYEVLPKKRGRKKKGEVAAAKPEIEYGSIVTVKCEGNMKGVDLKPKSKKKGQSMSWFRNAVTIVIMLDKPINFKVCKNGTFQMTGCTKDEHPEMCVEAVWKLIKNDPSIYTFTRSPDNFEVLIVPSMRNIDFDLGFNVDRDKLRKYLNRETVGLHCLLETSFGYTGVNIKIPLQESNHNMEICKIVYTNDGEIIKTTTNYLEYLGVLDEKNRTKKQNETRYNTFLVFHSGKVIFSGLTADFMRDTYYSFMKIIETAIDDIEEKLEK
jgi:hypothetical protein